MKRLSSLIQGNCPARTFRGWFLIGLLLFSYLAIAGCGGGGSSRSGGGGDGGTVGPTPVPVDPATISATLTSLDSKLGPIFQSDQSDTEPTLEQIKTVLETVADFQIISSDAADRTVVGKIGATGPEIYISLPPPNGNFNPEAQSLQKSIRNASVNSLPDKTKVLLLNGLGGDTYKDITPDIKKIFTDYYANPNYTVDLKPATIENLRAVNNVDVLFIKTHGVRTCAITPYDDPTQKKLATYAISSSTRVDLANPSPPAYNTDINKHNIVFIYAPTDKEGLVFKDYKYEWLYGITGGFVKDYWNINPGGMAFICACSSTSTQAIPFVQTVFNKGASAYFGWTAPIDSDFADNRVKYVFDRLLGANSFQKSTPEERAFTYNEIEQGMGTKRTWPGDGKLGPSTLEFIANPDNDQFGLLAPSIKYMEIDEKHNGGDPELTIYGTFGNKQGEVELIDEGGGNRWLSINSWSATKIKCVLPPDDYGDIVVKVNNIKSNKRRISKWEGKVTFTAAAPHPSSVIPEQKSCDLKDTVEWDLKIRADIATYRDKPGAAPVDRDVKFIPTKKSSTTYSSSGSQVIDTEDGPQTILNWSGGGSMVLFSAEDLNAANVCGYEMNTGQNMLKMNICFIGQVSSKMITFPYPPYSFPMAINLASDTVKGLYDERSPYSMPAKYIVYLTFDADWNIQAGQKQITVMTYDMAYNVSVTLKWDAMSIKCPPVEDKEHGK